MEVAMERLKKIILDGTGYTVLYLVIYYALGGALGGAVGATEITVSVGRFFLTLLFGFVISMTNFLFTGSSLKPWVKRLLAYLVSALAFFLIIILGYRLNGSGAGIFVGMVLFTAFYFAAVGASYLIRRTLCDESKSKARGAGECKDKKNNYKSLYKE